jgi:photosystem II stability/assembly factor-like uncharacterized protein
MHKRSLRRSALVIVVLAAVGLLRAPIAAQDVPPVSESSLAGLTWRNLGPFRAGSWISDIAVPERPARAHLYTFYVAVRYGGLWKTTNNGTTFELVFDEPDVTGIGCLAIAPSNPDVIYVGTGDAASVRVAYPGNGVYKSVDAGKTWRRVGLEATSQIGRIVVHPRDPDVVYVAAMGRLWSTGPERGVFKSTDGGKSWKKVLYVDEETGAIDIVVNRRDPDTLYAATYQVQRRPWRLYEGKGTGSGIHKTTDGGRTWKKLSGGLPRGPQGRIGLDIYQRDPDVLYAVTENLSLRPPTPPEIERAKARGVEARDRPIGGEVYRTDDGGRTWKKMNSAGDDVSSKAGYSFNQIRVDQQDDRKILINCDSLISSTDGGRTFQGLDWNRRSLFSSAFGDFRAMWIDPEDSNRMIMGTDGGVHVSYDGGKTVDHHYNLPGGEIYAIDVDMEDPYHIYAGLQDHDSWKGPINGPHGRVGPEDWVTVGDNDGMYNRVDPNDSRWVYNSIQWGGQFRADQKTHTRQSIVPTRPSGAPPLRFNWTPPILLSPHNSAIVYTGAQVLFRSLDRGDHWEEISPDLTTNDPERISPPGMTVQFCTLTTLSESPLKAGIIWTGADDGKVQVTTNHGASWTDVTANLAAAGAPAHYWTTRVLASRFAAGTAYVTKSGRRYDEMKTVVMKTTDFGRTWRSVAGDLPDRSLDVVVEDLEDEHILFAGSDRGVFVTLDGGGRWVAFKGNMPTVPVTDMVIHPREHDLVVATYGRGLFVTNVAWLAEVRQGALEKEAHLFAIRPRAMPRERPWGNFELYGDRHLIVPNDDGINVDFFLRTKPAEKVVVTLADGTGAAVRTLEAEGRAGLNRVSWDVTLGRGRRAAPGEYLVTVKAGGATLTGKAKVGAGSGT